MPKRVAFLIPYSLGIAPSQRFRVEQYIPLLKQYSIAFTLFPFLDEKTNRILYKKDYFLLKFIGILKGLARRLIFVLFQSFSYDIIFIHREASPIGPPIFEWMLKNIYRKTIIFDFDDAIWLPPAEKDSFIQKFKYPQKTNAILRWSTIVLAGNDYLSRHAALYARGEIIRLPTVVDTQTKYKFTIPYDRTSPVVVGWTGSHSTTSYLVELLPTLRNIYHQHPFILHIISDQDPKISFPDYVFIPWNTQSEMDDLLTFDIGIMPMKDSEWSKGKCGFKLIQYGALGIPSICDFTEANASIVPHTVGGFVCERTSDWESAMLQLLLNPALRQKMGSALKLHIQNHYSLVSAAPLFLKALQT
ncbi:MAG: glycosyltransferase family 1 protein [Cytophagaceae bacterium]|jgi:glycosyltransferase involved in cell wall biosynthesis|nr:glycosyltransferase family 1 protein [Cytophagaceae bacterium]